ncbi:MAG: alpha/beta hydrolase [Microlunatus sp.]
MRLVPRRLVAVAVALSAGLLSVTSGPNAEATLPVDVNSAATTAAPTKTATTSKTAKTSKTEKRRSKAVKAPKLKWRNCGSAKCATVKVPLDYDKPRGKKIKLAVLKRPVKNQKKKIGTLFVNPGGPGASGTDMAAQADAYLSPAVLKRFDVVGFDPRGVPSSQKVRCFSSQRKNAQVLGKIESVAFPYGAAEEKGLRAAYDKHAKACSTTGKPMTGAVSTAEVARDMDLLRRAVGDKKLSYLGFSYGSYLGAVYANLYPDRVRVIAIDGVLAPVKWAGTKSSQSTPIAMRLESAQGTSKVLRQALVLCRQAGPTKCRFSAGDPVANFETIAQRLRKAPVEIPFAEGNAGGVKLTYAEFISINLALLYFQEYAPEMVTDFASAIWDLLYPPAVDGADAITTRRTAARIIVKLQRTVESHQQTGVPGAAYAAPYDNSLDSFATIACTDSRNSKNLASFGEMGAEADRKAPYFGRLWLWNLASCSSKNWTVKDEDAYRGPFTKRTSSPVLIVGNYWDPATNYSGAVSTAKRMPNSRLLSSNSWGHTARGTSKCVDNAVDSYLLSKKLPAKGKVCTGDYRPFSEVLDSDGSVAAQTKALGKPSIAVPPVSPNLR